MNSDVDGEPMFADLDDDDPAVVASVIQARKSLSRFKTAFSTTKYIPAWYLVKVPLVDRSDLRKQALVRTSEVAVDNPTRPIVHLWLRVTSVLEDLFFCTIVEAPRQLRLKKGASFVIPEEVVEDWMINHEGVVYGGFSLRVARSRLRGKDRACFDEHIGIRKFK